MNKNKVIVLIDEPLHIDRRVQNAIKIYKACMASGKWEEPKEIKPVTDYEILEV